MPAVAIQWRLKRERPNKNAGLPAKPHPKAFLLAKNGAKFVFPYAPIPVDTDGYAGTWSQNARPGRKALLQRSGLSLRSMTFTCTLSQGGASLHNMIESLKRIVGGGESVTFSYASTETGIYQVTDLRLKVTRRQHITNQPTEAEATFTLTEQSLASLTLGPLTGGLPPTPNIAVAPNAGVPAGGVPPRPAPKPAGGGVQLRQNESIADFALRTTGSPTNWRAILTANRITNPKQLRAGMVLIVPTGLGKPTGSADSQYAANARARAEANQFEGRVANDGTTGRNFAI